MKRSHNRLYLLDLKVEQPVCLAARHTEEPWLWHAGSAILASTRLVGWRRWSEGCLTSSTEASYVTAAWPGSRGGYLSQRRPSIARRTLCGPITPTTNGGRRYFLLLVDDCSHYMWLQLLTSKDEAAVAIKKFKMCAEAESGKKLCVLRTDRGGEFTSVEFAAYCAD